MDLDSPILRAWASVSRVWRPLTTGIVRWQLTLWRGTMWRNNGWELHAKQLSLQAWYSYFKWRILTFTRWNWKCRVIIMIKTDLSGFVITMHLGLCKKYVKSLGLKASGFDFNFQYSCYTADQMPGENAKSETTKPLSRSSFWVNYGAPIMNTSNKNKWKNVRELSVFIPFVWFRDSLH